MGLLCFLWFCVLFLISIHGASWVKSSSTSVIEFGIYRIMHLHSCLAHLYQVCSVCVYICLPLILSHFHKRTHFFMQWWDTADSGDIWSSLKLYSPVFPSIFCSLSVSVDTAHTVYSQHIMVYSLYESSIMSACEVVRSRRTLLSCKFLSCLEFPSRVFVFACVVARICIYLCAISCQTVSVFVCDCLFMGQWLCATIFISFYFIGLLNINETIS